MLKTKNLYFVFDDTNGIGTLPYLVEQVLANTGWSIGECETFYEHDGATEKRRSISSDGKKGAYQLITEICNLFNAYPVFNGDVKKIDFRSLNHKLPQWEMTVGKNLNTLSVELDSDSIVTRLYVEGEYGDNGYVGIDDVNPTGLTYLLNFDYYKQTGLFTDLHQQSQDKYLATMSVVNKEIKELAAEKAKNENALNELWGQIKYVLYPLNADGSLSTAIVGGNVNDEDIPLLRDDQVSIVGSTDQYRIATIKIDNVIPGYQAGEKYAIKFITKASGLIGAKEVAIEAKKKLIANLELDLEKEIEDDEKIRIQEQITSIESDIAQIYTGSDEAEGLNSMMCRAAAQADVVNTNTVSLTSAQIRQNNAEFEFSSVMGDMLKDGYWSNTNYIVGQEAFLYADALDVSAEISKPKVTYTISLSALSKEMGYTDEHMELNSAVRLYDVELEINDIVFVKRITRYLDDPTKSTVEISNEDIILQGQTLDSILSRITQIADLIDQKGNLLNRVSDTISSDGSVFIERLNGQIDVLKNRLLSTTSNWYTDAQGNIIFEEVNGHSAMMQCGEGFMIANGKNSLGEWNWRTFGTGEGFTADAIIAGYLSADRIEAGSIGSGKLETQLATDIGKIPAMQEALIELSPEKIISTVLTSTEYKEQISTIEQTSDQIKSTVTDQTERVGKAESSITQNANEIKTKVSYTDYNTKINSLESSITQNATQIQAKVSQSVYDEDMKTIESDISTLTQTAQEIRSDLTSTTSDQDGRLTKAESNITQNANSISTKVSYTEYNTKISTMESSITQNADSISTKVSKDGIISSINQSSEAVTISADKISQIGASKISLEGLTTVNSNFIVNTDGSIKAVNADITGTITATNGKIGGWTIGTDSLYAGSGTNRVSLSTGDSTYAIWAGAESSSAAPFRVTKDGIVYLTKMYVTNEEGVAQSDPVNLRTSYWKMDAAYSHSVKTLSVSNNTQTIELYNGTSVNFKKAATGTLVGSGNGADNFTVSYITDYTGPGTGTVVDSGTVKLALNSTTYNASSSVIASFDGTAYGTIPVGSVYTAGVNSVTVPNASIVRQAADYYAGGDDHSTTVYIKATASNGNYGTQSFSVSGASAYNAGKSAGNTEGYNSGYSAGKTDGANSVTLSAGGWQSNATNTITASNGQTISVSVPNVTLSQGSWSSGSKTVGAYYGNSGRLGYTTVTIPDISISWSNPAQGNAMVTVTCGGKTVTSSKNVSSYV